MTGPDPETNQSILLDDQSRPVSITILSLIVLILASMNLVRWIESIVEWNMISDNFTVSPLYILITGLIWSITGFYLLYGLWIGKPWAPNQTRIVSIAFTIYVILDRFLLSQIKIELSSRIYLVVLLVVMNLLIYWNFTRKRVKAYFGENYD